ncbi:MAG: fucose isomerase, partial [Duncaniella sp.]|nr:fucose isomerase [Duncaniella sp.]
MKKDAINGKETFGIIIGTRAYFNSDLAIDVRKTLLEDLEKAGYGYVILDECDTPTDGSMETLEDGKKWGELVRKYRVEIDGIIVSL